MSEGLANATYRAFNFPHHVTTYFALYLAARNTELQTVQTWRCVTVNLSDLGTTTRVATRN